MAVKSKNQGQWVQESLRKLEAVGDIPLSAACEGDTEWPEWVSNLWVMLMRVSHPGVKVKDMKQWKPKDLGRFVGRHYALVGMV